MVGVEQAQDSFSGSFPVITLKGLHIDALGVSLAQARRELHLAVDGIIVLNEPADEADNDYGRRGAGRVANRLWNAGLGKGKGGTDGNSRSAQQPTKSTKGGSADHEDVPS